METKQSKVEASKKSSKELQKSKRLACEEGNTHCENLIFKKNPQNVLVLKRSPTEKEITNIFVNFVIWMKSTFKSIKKVYVQLSLMVEEDVAKHENYKELERICLPFTDSLSSSVDLGVIFGGDGLLLVTNSMFPNKFHP